MALTADIEFIRGGWSLRTALDIPAHGITAVYGPSGCGKTTLLRVLAGLERGAEATRIRFNDTIWQAGSVCVPPEARGIGFVFQDGRLLPHLSVAGNLRYAQVRRSGARGPGAAEVCRWLQIDDLLARKPQQLSGGQQQRVAIARALLQSPRLLLLDEPLTGLDQDNREKAMQLLESLHRRLAIPVIYVSHNSDEVQRLADRVVQMAGGRVTATGDIEAMTTRLDSPLAAAGRASTILHGIVAGSDQAYGLSRIDIGSGLELLLRQTRAPVGAAVRLRIPASSISISRSRAADSSILNILPVRVENWHRQDDCHTLLQLSLGRHHLLALITRMSLERLALQPGDSVFAQIKGAALLSDYR